MLKYLFYFILLSISYRLIFLFTASREIMSSPNILVIVLTQVLLLISVFTSTQNVLITAIAIDCLIV